MHVVGAMKYIEIAAAVQCHPVMVMMGADDHCLGRQRSITAAQQAGDVFA